MTEKATRRCLGTAWIVGWALAVYVPSLLIVLVQPALAGTDGGLFARWIDVADEIAPAAKLMLGGSMLCLLLVADRLGRKRGVAAAGICALAAMVAMLLTLLLIPAGWSRGFGVGLGTERLSSALLPLYLAGSIVAGVAQAATLARCRKRMRRVRDA